MKINIFLQLSIQNYLKYVFELSEELKFIS